MNLPWRPYTSLAEVRNIMRTGIPITPKTIRAWPEGVVGFLTSLRKALSQTDP